MLPLKNFNCCIYLEATALIVLECSSTFTLLVYVTMDNYQNSLCNSLQQPLEVPDLCRRWQPDLNTPKLRACWTGKASILKCSSSVPGSVCSAPLLLNLYQQFLFLLFTVNIRPGRKLEGVFQSYQAFPLLQHVLWLHFRLRWVENVHNSPDVSSP